MPMHASPLPIEQRHLRAHVDRVGHFSCPHCAKEFSVKHKFQRHLRLHEAERRFACAVCGRAFLQREFLARHARTHSGATPFACDTCGKAFNQLVNLRQHQERVHRAQGRALRHHCRVCDKVSQSPYVLWVSLNSALPASDVEGNECEAPCS